MAGTTRRTVLTLAAAATGAAVATGPPATASRRRRGVTTIVLVSGANGSAGGDAELALRGHRVLGVPLPGQAPADGQFRRSYQCPQDLAALATEPSPMAGITLGLLLRRPALVRRLPRHPRGRGEHVLRAGRDDRR